jgi:hypothetical protein
MAMKRIRQCRWKSLGSVAVVCALAAIARGADPVAPLPPATGATQGAAPVVAPNAPVAPVVPSPPSTGAAPSLPDLGSAAFREESAPALFSSYAPNEIGDNPFSSTTYRLTFVGGTTNAKFVTFQVPSPSASMLGAQRLGDDDCTLPRDRVFADYSFFHDAQLGTPSDANRFVPGFEKTFLDGRMSVEMRFPMGSLASNDFTVNGSSVGTTDQFGDIQVIVKALLARNETWALGMGMGISVPTAPDVTVANFTGGPLAQITNHSTHLLPYFAALYTPNEDWFVQAFTQVDVAASGNPVSYNPFGNNMISVGTIYDQTMLFADVSVGRWLFRNPEGRFSGLAAVVEAHYTGGLNAPSTVQTNNFSVSYPTVEYNVLDLTVGAHAVIGKSTVTLGFSTPLTEDRGFDGELRLFVNRRF